MKLLTIIVDDSLKHIIEQEIMELGAKGYTASEVEGRGISGVRDDGWYGLNVKIESIVPDEVLRRILSRLQEHYFDRYPIIAYHVDVEVVRQSRF